ncbi:MAG: nitrogen fixation protein NifX [Nitrospiraceae bacterium]|nr:nitrogen fixation protein NifX [Nitrospiraceae bacterium]
MKVAFATADGVDVDEHFGRAGTFSVFEINAGGYMFVEERKFCEEGQGNGRDRAVEETKGMGQAHDDIVQQKVDRLADCKIIYMTEIGGPSAARLTKKGIMPLKVREPVPIRDVLEKLLLTIKTSPPPWIKKAL